MLAKINANSESHPYMFMSLAQQPRKEEKQERQIYYCKFPKSKIEWLNKLETRAANSLFHIGAHSSTQPIRVMCCMVSVEVMSCAS